ncbi:MULTISPECIES: nitrate reductase molybdenum cofactor assembly chaperone [unclassified Microbacterium]|uniref:nitrate reductase molybdenum cofactor assembly chaperone n=1 Tax=unclassified Microbacterium TaxID=2609290 RepID=UPI00214C9722|nr:MULTISPECIES: nitrate reductase molybdenum cofactor assembly chaperone [unclassified Microbacterium]MCR2811165.1 nitrate reductase molybdenum cofactor assembly chaperone [Microbacterium sp. zg.B185]WIM20722.1 nitrate reductase molybdenum cofactor assembly chaperone [Microbacterium sp. zg-B185]
MNRAVIYQAASVTLSYPTAEVLGMRGVIRRAVSETAPAAGTHFAPLLEWWETTPAETVQQTYVDVFDMSKRHALYLSYWTDGDTRRRGQVLAELKQRYREHGLELATTGELPDHLPLVLEFARHAPDAGAALLQEYRASLELIRIALAERESPYAGVLAGICQTLPGRSPHDRQQAMAMAAAGPPAESVGLDAYDPRLLPLAGSEGGR